MRLKKFADLPFVTIYTKYGGPQVVRLDAAIRLIEAGEHMAFGKKAFDVPEEWRKAISTSALTIEESNTNTSYEPEPLEKEEIADDGED